jgi:O-antigen/teichoic acid export membrane protein
MVHHREEALPSFRREDFAEAVPFNVTDTLKLSNVSSSRVAINTAANFLGSSVTQAAAFIFAIAYFRLLGPQNYGLIGFSIALVQLGAYFADMGVGRVVVRELSRRSHARDFAEQMGDVLFTLQITNFALALAVGTTIAANAGWLTQNWLKIGDVPADDAVHAIVIMGLIAILQLPKTISLEALRGLQKQVLSNSLMGAFSWLRGCVTLAALYFIAPTAIVFLTTQLVLSFAETTFAAGAAWRSMPRASRLPRFRLRILRETWAFALADGGAVLISAGMMLGDKIILSRLLPLDEFGSYVFCASLAEAVGRVSSPFNSAFFPHFVDLVARNDEKKLSRDYLRVTQIVASMLVPISLTIAVFSHEILQLLTNKPAVVASFALVLSVRTLANMFNCLQHMPHSLQLTIGLSSLAFKLNLVSICVYLPGIILLTPRFGPIVPAALWLAINVANAFPMVIGTHRRILQGDLWNWTWGTIVRPLAISTVIVAGSWLLYPGIISWLVTLPWLAVTSMTCCVVILLASPRTRELVLRVVRYPFQHQEWATQLFVRRRR